MDELISSFLVPILVAVITVKLTYRSEGKKFILEKRVALYSGIINRAEALSFNRSLIFTEEFRNSVLKFKPQVLLLASDTVQQIYEDFYHDIDACFQDYRKFIEENDPAGDPQNFEQIPNENGELEEVSYVHQEDMDYFDEITAKYLEEHLPKEECVQSYKSRLYTAMKKDLGINPYAEKVSAWISRHLPLPKGARG